MHLESEIGGFFAIPSTIALGVILVLAFIPNTESTVIEDESPLADLSPAKCDTINDTDFTLREILDDNTDSAVVTIPNKINEEQGALLLYAYNVAKADGHRDPTVLQGLIWQESHAGGYPGYEVAGDEYGLTVGKRYYGVSQIKVDAARDVFKRFPGEFADFISRTDEFIIAKLIFDDKFSIRVASKYLWMMGHTPKQTQPTNFAITAYNQGAAGAKKLDYNAWHYTVAVINHKNTIIKKFNLLNNIR